MSIAQPPINARASHKSTIIVLGLVFATVHLICAALLTAYAYLVHFYDGPGAQFRSGPYLLTAFGFLLAAWGVGWGRLWTIGVVAGLFSFVAFVLYQGLRHFDPPRGQYALYGAIEVLITLTLFLLTLAALGASAVFVMWRKGWRLPTLQKWKPLVIEVSELFVAAALLPVLHHLDYTVPARLKAQDSAAVAAEIAEIRRAGEARDAEVQAAVKDFIDGVREGDDARRKAAETRIAQIKDRIYFGDLNAIESHPSADVRHAFVALAHRERLGAAADFMLQVAANRGESIELRRLSMEFLLAPKHDQTPFDCFLEQSDSPEAMGVLLELLAAADPLQAPAELKVRGIETIAYLANRLNLDDNQLRDIVQVLSRLTQSDEAESVKRAAMEALAEILTRS